MPPAPDDRLDSWKEIAVFLKRAVRTVQRWEKQEGLPVHRHQHARLGSVYAFRPEVLMWWESRRKELEHESETARQGSAAPSRIKLLVLPLDNLSGDPAQDYLAEGLTDEIITQLARIQPERLAVIARTTAMHFKGAARRLGEIARELAVDYVIEGSVRGTGERVRVAAQLITAADETHVWAQNYDRELRDLLSLETEVAGAVAKEIRLTLDPTSPKPTPAIVPQAYDHYLRGRYLLNRMTPQSIGQSIGWFQKAVQAQPDCALAYASISHACALLAMVPLDVLPPRESMPNAAAAAERALALAPDLPEAHAALAVVRHHYDWDWKAAETCYRRTLDLSPDYSGARVRYAWLLLSLSRIAEAQEQVSRAQRTAEETDPHLLVVIRATRAAAFYFARNYESCLRECRDALELDPDYFLLHYLLGRALARQGAHQEAATILARESASPIALLQMGAGLAHAMSGRKPEAAAALEALIQSID
jgi:TolB-like protein